MYICIYIYIHIYIYTYKYIYIYIYIYALSSPSALSTPSLPGPVNRGTDRGGLICRVVILKLTVCMGVGFQQNFSASSVLTGYPSTLLTRVRAGGDAPALRANTAQHRLHLYKATWKRELKLPLRKAGLPT